MSDVPACSRTSPSALMRRRAGEGHMGHHSGATVRIRKTRSSKCTVYTEYESHSVTESQRSNAY